MKKEFKNRLGQQHIITEDTDLERFLTNFDEEKKQFYNIISSNPMYKRFLIINGVGGIGKSTLLRMYRIMCRKLSIPISLVEMNEFNNPVSIMTKWATDLSELNVELPNFSSVYNKFKNISAKIEKRSRNDKLQGKEIGKTVTGDLVGTAVNFIPIVGPLVSGISSTGTETFIEWLQTFLSKSEIDFYSDPIINLTDAFLNDIETYQQSNKIVLMLDTYDKAVYLDSWLMNITRKFGQNTLIVIAGRTFPIELWSKEFPGWMTNAKLLEVKPMSDDHLRDLIYKYYQSIQGSELDNNHVVDVVNFARGYPLAATTIVRLWSLYGSGELLRVKAKATSDMVDRIMEEVPIEMAKIVEITSILRWFDKSIIRSIMKKDINNSDYNQLLQFPFVIPFSQGKIAIHDVVREIVDENLYIQDPDMHTHLHEQAALYFEHKMSSLKEENWDQVVPEYVFHKFKADENEAIIIFCQLCEELATARLIIRLRAILNCIDSISLKQMGSLHWHKYYLARLKLIEGDTFGAETLFREISTDNSAPEKLQAYSKCDLGRIITKWERLGQPGVINEAINLLKESISIIDIDKHLIGSLFRLSRIYEYQGYWEEAINYTYKSIEICQNVNDNFGLIYSYNHLKGIYAFIGDWDQMVEIHQISQKENIVQSKDSHIRAEFLGHSSWAFALSGRYAEAEKNTIESITITQKLENDAGLPFLYRNLGFIFSLQCRFVEANDYFQDSVEISRSFGDDYLEDTATTLSMWGISRAWDSDTDQGKSYLSDGLVIKERLQDRIGIPETAVWLGYVYELEGSFEEAEKFYNKCLQWKWIGLKHIESEAMTSLCRLLYLKGDSSEKLLQMILSAEKLASENKYYEHLATIYLIKGHISWDGYIPNYEVGAKTVINFYKQSLTYALLYNRYLLDEILAGQGRRSLITPIIDICKENGDEGIEMLNELKLWWQNSTSLTSNNQLNKEPSTFHEKEIISRNLEIGDKKEQIYLVDRITNSIILDN